MLTGVLDDRPTVISVVGVDGVHLVRGLQAVAGVGLVIDVDALVHEPTKYSSLLMPMRWPSAPWSSSPCRRCPGSRRAGALEWARRWASGMVVLVEGAAGEVVGHAEGGECYAGPYVGGLDVACDEGDEESRAAAGGGDAGQGCRTGPCEYGVGFRTVKAALESVWPSQRKKPLPRGAPRRRNNVPSADHLPFRWP